MPRIIARNIALEYPLFVSLNAALKPSLLGAVGANVENSQGALTHIRALEGISFDLKSGQRLGLIGRNGSGKSTLLRVLSGVYEPTEGSLQVEGRVAPMFAMGLGVRREATGRRNIHLRGLVYGLSRREIAAKAEEIIEFSELGQFIDMPVRSYSAGMAMRLAFAIGTTFSPEILLMDEWIGAGDQNFQQKAQKRMSELVEEAGITVIASHNRGLLKKVCDQCLWLDRGRMRKIGPIDEVFAAMDEAEQREKESARLAAPAPGPKSRKN